MQERSIAVGSLDYTGSRFEAFTREQYIGNFSEVRTTVRGMVTKREGPPNKKTPRYNQPRVNLRSLTSHTRCCYVKLKLYAKSHCEIGAQCSCTL